MSGAGLWVGSGVTEPQADEGREHHVRRHSKAWHVEHALVVKARRARKLKRSRILKGISTAALSVALVLEHYPVVWVIPAVAWVIHCGFWIFAD